MYTLRCNNICSTLGTCTFNQTWTEAETTHSPPGSFWEVWCLCNMNRDAFPECHFFLLVYKAAHSLSVTSFSIVFWLVCVCCCWMTVSYHSCAPISSPSIRDALLSSFTSHSSVVCESKKWTLNSILTIFHGALCNYLFRRCLSYSPFSNVWFRKIQVKKKCNVHFLYSIKPIYFILIFFFFFTDNCCLVVWWFNCWYLNCLETKKTTEKLECLEFCCSLSQDVQHFMMLLPKWHSACCVQCNSLGS